jgi:hypothetical protein
LSVILGLLQEALVNLVLFPEILNSEFLNAYIFLPFLMPLLVAVLQGQIAVWYIVNAN